MASHRSAEAGVGIVSNWPGWFKGTPTSILLSRLMTIEAHH